MKHGRDTHMRQVCSTDTQAHVEHSCFFAAQFGTNEPNGRDEQESGKARSEDTPGSAGMRAA
jgi:hypothetical protein